MMMAIAFSRKKKTLFYVCALLSIKKNVLLDVVLVLGFKSLFSYYW